MDQNNQTTDKEKFLKLLAEFDIGYRIIPDDRYDAVECVTLECGEDKNVGGYMGFSAHWFFNSDGKFTTLTLWE